MNKTETINKIYDTLMENGTVGTKGDTLGADLLEDKVYTKRLPVNKNLGEGPNTIELVYVSIKSDDPSFSDTTSADVRINTKNIRDQWCNIFIDEATDEMLELVENTIL